MDLPYVPDLSNPSLNWWDPDAVDQAINSGAGTATPLVPPPTATPASVNLNDGDRPSVVTAGEGAKAQINKAGQDQFNDFVGKVPGVITANLNAVPTYMAANWGKAFSSFVNASYSAIGWAFSKLSVSSGS
jgi:hypothetical protein